MTTPPTPPRPEPVATADLVAQARERAPRLSWTESLRALLYALAKALEDTVAERDRAVEVLAELVRLKDGLRDDAYRAAKEPAWEAARKVVRP